MSLEENKALVRSHFEELINRKNPAAAERQVAPDFVDHEAPPDLPRGPEGVQRWIRMLLTAFPDLQVTIHDIIAEGDRVVVRNTWHGTHQGPFFGVAATWHEVTIKGIVIWRVAEGKLVERWACTNASTVVQRLAAQKPKNNVREEAA